MLFQLTNAPAVFVNTYGQGFHRFLHQLIIVFIDDILSILRHGSRMIASLHRI